MSDIDFRTKTPRAYAAGDFIMVEARGSNPSTSTGELIDPATLPTNGTSFDILSGGVPETNHEADDFVLTGGSPA